LSDLPIGIFDSGVGGLTVLRAIRDRLPLEGLIYLGDTARVPYGTKSKKTIERYALEDSEFLLRKGIKTLVIACNTASALARSALREHLTLPILSVVGPGARAAARETRSGRIGVIATEATVESGAYPQAIREAGGERDLEIIAQACPLFVPLVEEGEIDSQIATLAAEKYLAPLKEMDIDTLVLGCTHYPLLRNVIAKVLGSGVTLVDSAQATADEVAQLLIAHNLQRTTREPKTEHFFVTDATKRFHSIAERILGGPLPHLEAVELGVYG
jgi:glutamate racemase